MSTEHQRYSMENQKAAIADYASAHGLGVVRTYADPGRSGLSLKGRPGLQQLLSDAIRPDRDFSVILALDVSRWGRFQDIDQAAHYEFICKEAGVRVVYCAEPFQNDGSMVSSVLKHLKRLMAAEYSRELSTKLVRARHQQARLGFRQGGQLVYGFRRQLVTDEGVPRQILDAGNHKALRSDRVRTVLGPQAELELIRRIFRTYIARNGSFALIARQLNEEGIPSGTGRPWTEGRVGRLIRNELCVGDYTFNKVSKRLHGPTVRNPEEDWIRVRVSDPVVEPAIFRKAQSLAAGGGRHRFTDQQMLDRLRGLLTKMGRLSPALIDAAPNMPSASTYEKRFGSIARAYELVGYSRSPYKWREQAGGYWTDEAILAAVKACEEKHGYVSAAVLGAEQEAPSPALVRRRFGSLRRCYELAGLPHALGEIIDAAHMRRRERLVGGVVEADMLQALRTVLQQNGRLSTAIINAAPQTLGVTSYRRVFGTLRRAYVLIEYLPPRYFNARDAGRKTSEAYLLEGLRRLLRQHGYLDAALISAAPDLPGPWVYGDRFGGLMNAYRLAGWNVSRGDLIELAKARKRVAAQISQGA